MRLEPLTSPVSSQDVILFSSVNEDKEFFKSPPVKHHDLFYSSSSNPFFPTSSCQFCMCCLVWSSSLLFVPHEGCNFHATLACEFVADLPQGQCLLWSEGKCHACLHHKLQEQCQSFIKRKKNVFKITSNKDLSLLKEFVQDVIILFTLCF